MNHQEFSRKGGKSKSKKKMDAMLRNLQKGREYLKKNRLKRAQSLED